MTRAEKVGLLVAVLVLAALYFGVTAAFAKSPIGGSAGPHDAGQRQE